MPLTQYFHLREFILWQLQEIGTTQEAIPRGCLFPETREAPSAGSALQRWEDLRAASPWGESGCRPAVEPVLFFAHNHLYLLGEISEGHPKNE